MFKFKHYFAASATLAGTILGVGMFGLPHIFSKSGFLTGLLMIFVCSGLSLLNHLLYGEALMRTQGDRRLPGLVGFYFGQKMKIISAIMAFISMSGALIAYLILGGEFTKNLFQIFGHPVSANLALIIFWLLGTIGMTMSIGIIGAGEIIGLIMIMALIGIFFFLGTPKLDWQWLNAFDLKKIFLPYGSLLFALSGASAIPEIFNYFKKSNLSEKKIDYKKPIIIGSLLPAFLYLAFIIGAFGLLGNNIPLNFSSKLISDYPFLGVATNLLGIVLILTSYFILGLSFKNTMRLDIKLPNWLSWLLPAAIPLLLYFSGIKNFLGVVGFIGAVILAGETILTIMSHKASQKKGEKTPAFSVKMPIWAAVILTALLLIGAVLEIAKFFQ